VKLIHEIRRARKQYQCTEQSYHTIHPGTYYLYGVCPPWHEANRSRPGEKRYDTIRACLRCTERFGLHNSDTHAQLERKITA